MVYEWIMLAVGLLLTVGTGLFVASEFALVNLDRGDLEARRERGESRLTMTIAALKITSTHLSSAQLGITLTTLLTGYTMEPALSNLLRPTLVAWSIPEAAIAPIATVVAMFVATVLSMILGELVPKNFALALPLATAKLVVPFQIALAVRFIGSPPRPSPVRLSREIIWRDCIARQRVFATAFQGLPGAAASDRRLRIR